MNKYIVNANVAYKIIEAETATEAMAENIINSIDIEKDDLFWSKEELRINLIQKGYKYMRPTKHEGIYRITKA